MRRREFLATTAVSALGASAREGLAARTKQATKPREHSDAANIPRWRGFNLQEMFGWGRKPGPFSALDFELMADWGFNFVRLPLTYWNWSDRRNWMTIDERPLEYIDQAIELGRQHGIHVSLNFHRIPGYCITQADAEPALLFHGPAKQRQKALAAATHHWQHFARRYKGIPGGQLSFNLLNEPPFALADEALTRALQAQLPEFAAFLITERDYEQVVRSLVAAIRRVDPDRLIVVDGLNVGRKPVHGLADLGLVHGTRGYDPVGLTHYRASWTADGPPWLTNRTPPTWPLLVKQKDFKHPLMGTLLGCGRWNKPRLRRELIEPWKELEAKGTRVHVGECGVHNQTPHDVTLAWMRDALSLWKEAGWGYALWELRGTFGVLDSRRSDVKYETCKGHKLDRRMLALFQEV